MEFVDISPYIKLVESFLDGKISAKEYEKEFLDLRSKNLTLRFEIEEQYFIIEKLFEDVDCFCADPSLRDEKYDIDEAELREGCKAALPKLREALQNSRKKS